MFQFQVSACLRTLASSLPPWAAFFRCWLRFCGTTTVWKMKCEKCKIKLGQSPYITFKLTLKQISKVWCKTMINPVPERWRYSSLAPSHWHQQWQAEEDSIHLTLYVLNFSEETNIYLHLMSLLPIDKTQLLKNPSSSKTRTYIFYIVNIMASDVLAT